MKIKYIMFLFSVLIFLSCENIIEITPGIEDFNVTVENAIVKVGEEVLFTFNGKPDLVSFYSGEVYHQYEYREGRKENVLETILSFSTACPSLENSQTDQLSVLISTNYVDNGNDYADIVAANWIDITDRFAYATAGVYINSGDLDISDLIKDNQSYNVAFRYKNNLMLGTPRRWSVQNFLLTAKTENMGNIYVASTASAGFRLVEQFPDYPSQSTVSTSLVTLWGATSTNNGISETWAVSSKFNSGAFDFGPDRTIAIKGIGIDMETYKYVYDKAGEYNVVFIAKNVTVDQEKEVKRNLIVKIEE